MRRCRVRVVAAIALVLINLVLGRLPALAGQASMTSIAPLDRVIADDIALKPHFTGFRIDDDPASPALLAHFWSDVADLAMPWLDAQPAGTERATTAWLGGGLQLEAQALDERSWVVAARRDESGTVFIATQRNGHHSVAWSITTPDAHMPGPFAAWLPGRATEGCRQLLSNTAWRACGPLFASVERLPPERTGRRRFVIDATYAQSMGGTVAGQLSIWAWDGSRATPLLTTVYGYMVLQHERLEIDRDRLRLHEKGDFKAFFVCGECEGRQLTRTIRVTPERVEDLGETSDVLDLDLADAMFAAILDHRAPGAIAEPSAAAALRRILDRVGPLAMTDAWSERRVGSARSLCINTMAGTFGLTIGERAGRPLVLAVRDLVGAGCAN